MDYRRAWKDTVEQLKQIGKDDQAFVDAGLDTDRDHARAIAAGLYVRYMVASNELTTCHDSLIQPQIRILIKKMLMCVYGRILELKKLLVDEDFSIYTPVIEELKNMKVQYDQFELKIPRCFRDERRSLLDDINNEIDEINRRIFEENFSEIHEEETAETGDLEEHLSSASHSTSGETSESEFDAATIFLNEQKMQINFRGITEEDVKRELAIKYIQKHIRAAKDRVIVNEILADKRARENIISGKYIKPSKEKTIEAVVKIQRYWKSYRIRRKNKVKKQKRHILIGLHMSSERPDFNDGNEIEDEIRASQTEAATEFWKLINKLQKNFNQRSKYEIIEEIEDELRSYIWTYFETCKHLPTWPDPAPIMFTDNNILGLPPIILPDSVLKQLNIPKVYYKAALNQRVPLGGSAIFHTGRWMTIEMAEILSTLIVEFENKPAKERNKLTKEYAKKIKLERETNKKNEKAAMKAREDSKAFGVLPEPSDLTDLFKEALVEFDDNWKIYSEFDEQPREDLIKSEIFGNAQIELRAEVDKTINEELIRLKTAYFRDRGKKFKPPKAQKPKRAKSRSRKKNLPSPEEILEELVRSDMIKKSVCSKFSDFQGEVSYSANVLTQEPIYSDPPYGLGDVRQMIKEFCVMGLIFEELRTLKRVNFSSAIMIAGPEKSGKTMLTNAVCWETGSLKIELTLENVSNNCINVKQVNRLADVITKFAKTYQPVVIEVDMADVPFYKKTPKDLKLLKPKLMQKAVQRLLKSIKKTERILIIGKATSPWLTASNKLTSVYNTIVFTVSDYTNVFMFLNELLMSYQAVERDFPVTSLTAMLADYPRQVVADIVAEVMTEDRVLLLRFTPLDPREFVPVMMKYPKIPGARLCDRYHNWYNQNVPMGIKKGLKMLEKKTVKKKKIK